MPSCARSCFRSELGERDYLQEVIAKNERLRGSLRWALGEEPDADGKWFGDYAPDDTTRRRYWWRTPLRRISGIDEQTTKEPLK